MAIMYKWELLINKALKQKIKQENKPDSKEEKRKRDLFRKKIRTIWPKPQMHLYEWKIIAEDWDFYIVKVKARQSNYFEEIKIVKNRIYFAK